MYIHLQLTLYRYQLPVSVVTAETRMKIYGPVRISTNLLTDQNTEYFQISTNDRRLKYGIYAYQTHRWSDICKRILGWFSRLHRGHVVTSTLGLFLPPLLTYVGIFLNLIMQHSLLIRQASCHSYASRLFCNISERESSVLEYNMLQTLKIGTLPVKQRTSYVTTKMCLHLLYIT